jgi:hypothetical protein
MEIQLKYLEGMIRLGYSPDQAMDSWNKSVRSKRERDKRGPERDKIETSEILLSGRISPEEFINYQETKLNKVYWDNLINYTWKVYLIISIKIVVLLRLLPMR